MEWKVSRPSEFIEFHQSIKRSAINKIEIGDKNI